MKKEGKITSRERMAVLEEMIREAYEYGAVPEAKKLEVEYCELLLIQCPKEYVKNRR